jgi:hypothetical protein
MTSTHFKRFAVAGSILLATACHSVPEAEDIVAPESGAATSPVADTVMAGDERSATVTIGYMPSGALGFTSACSGVTYHGGGSGGCVLLTGDLDLRGYGPGDMPITVTIDPVCLRSLPGRCRLGRSAGCDPAAAAAIRPDQLARDFRGARGQFQHVAHVHRR